MRQDNPIAYRKPQGFALMKFLKSFWGTYDTDSPPILS